MFLTLRAGSGEHWKFMVDTGSAVTILDKSLEPKLGKRLETKTVEYGWLGKRIEGVYASPKLYLGDTQLMTGGQVWTDDLNSPVRPGRQVQGILGTDCLHYYCIQLDFAGRKLRFLDPNHPGGKELGRAFPLAISRANITIHGALMGAKDVPIGVDTAAYDDGALGAEAFQQEVSKQNDIFIRQWKNEVGTQTREGRFREGVFGSDAYRDLILMECPTGENFIGLRFLARHLVTFDFPKRMLYLKRVSIDPLAEVVRQADKSGT